MTRVETNVLHASGLIRMVDASGLQPAGENPRIDRVLDVELSTQPSDLAVHAKPGDLVLWRNRAAVLNREFRPIPKDPETPYPLHGSVRDPRGLFHPVRFEVMAGNSATVVLPLQRSCAGVAFGHQQGIFGNVVWSGPEQKPASWVMLELTVDPSLTPGDEQVYRAQADIHGDFRLSLAGLPPIRKDDPQPFHLAQLKVRGIRAASGTEEHDLSKAMNELKIESRLVDGADSASIELNLEQGKALQLYPRDDPPSSLIVLE